jgi:uncharacterized protein YdhG (YjbR/CyaY superfamily)
MAKTIKNPQAETIDGYIAGFPKDIQKLLQEVRAAIHQAAPKAEETIKYAIPTFTLNGNLVSFGAWRNHIGLYPVPRTADGFKKTLSAYEGSKSTIKFTFDKPLPLTLITKIVKYNAKRNLERTRQSR